MFRKRQTLGEFGIKPDQSKASPKASATPTPVASQATATAKVEQPLFGVTIRPGKTQSITLDFKPSQPDKKLAALGKVLERYITAFKRELIIDDLMRDFMDGTEQFLEEANKYYASSGLGNFLTKYTKPYDATLSVRQLNDVLSRLSNLDRQHPLDQILVIREQILAGNKMHLLLANLSDSSANELRAFSEDYQQLTNAEREQVTDKIIGSLALLDADYLSGILAYATTTPMCKRDTDFNIIYKTEVTSKTETTIETATTIEKNGKLETHYTLDHDVTLVTRTTDPEIEMLERFPMRASAEIANLLNDAENRRAAILQAERQSQAEMKSKDIHKNTLVMNSNTKTLTSMISLFQQPLKGTNQELNRPRETVTSPRNNMTKTKDTHHARALSLLNLSNEIATKHHVASRQSSMGSYGV